MNKNLKPCFKTTSINKLITVKKTGPKMYINTKNFIGKNKVNFNKYITGYNCTFNLCSLNTLLVKSFSLNKKDKEYARCIAYPNILYSQLFYKKNVK